MMAVPWLRPADDWLKICVLSGTPTKDLDIEASVRPTVDTETSFWGGELSKGVENFKADFWLKTISESLGNRIFEMETISWTILFGLIWVSYSSPKHEGQFCWTSK